MKGRVATRFVICVENGGYDRDLIPLKLYRAVSDDNIDPEDIRVIDETGEDYIYPAEYFIPVEVSEKDAIDIRRVLAAKL